MENGSSIMLCTIRITNNCTKYTDSFWIWSCHSIQPKLSYFFRLSELKNFQFSSVPDSSPVDFGSPLLCSSQVLYLRGRQVSKSKFQRLAASSLWRFSSWLTKRRFSSWSVGPNRLLVASWFLVAPWLPITPGIFVAPRSTTNAREEGLFRGLLVLLAIAVIQPLLLCQFII